MHKKFLPFIFLFFSNYFYPVKYTFIKQNKHKKLSATLSKKQKNILNKYLNPTINKEHNLINTLLTSINAHKLTKKEFLQIQLDANAKHKNESNSIVENSKLHFLSKKQVKTIKSVFSNEKLKKILDFDFFEKVYCKNSKTVKKLIVHRKNKKQIIFYSLESSIEETHGNIIFLPQHGNMSHNEACSGILHELGHLFYRDTKKMCYLNFFYKSLKSNISLLDYKKVKSKISKLQEKNADIWASLFGNKYAQGLIESFKKHSAPESECHPSTEERITYLNTIMNHFPSKN